MPRFGPSALEQTNGYITAWLGERLHIGDANDPGKVREYNFRWREKADLVAANCNHEHLRAFIYERSLPPWLQDRLMQMRGEKLQDQPSMETLATWVEKLAATARPGREVPQPARANCAHDLALAPADLDAHLHFTTGDCPWLTEGEFNERRRTRRCYGCGSDQHVFVKCESPNGKSLRESLLRAQKGPPKVRPRSPQGKQSQKGRFARAHCQRDPAHGPGVGLGLLPRLPPPSCARPVSGVGLGPSCYPASLLWSPGPRPSPVFRSAICDCLSLNVSVPRAVSLKLLLCTFAVCD